MYICLPILYYIYISTDFNPRSEHRAGLSTSNQSTNPSNFQSLELNPARRLGTPQANMSPYTPLIRFLLFPTVAANAIGLLHGVHGAWLEGISPKLTFW